MSGVNLKGRAKIGHGERFDEVEVINGAIKVKVVARGTTREGYGSAQLKCGIAAHGEAVITTGAVKVKVV